MLTLKRRCQIADVQALRRAAPAATGDVPRLSREAQGVDLRPARPRPRPKLHASVLKQRGRMRDKRSNRGSARSSESRTADSSFLPSHQTRMSGTPPAAKPDPSTMNSGVPGSAGRSAQVVLLTFGALFVQFLFHLLSHLCFIGGRNRRRGSLGARIFARMGGEPLVVVVFAVK